MAYRPTLTLAMIFAAALASGPGIAAEANPPSAAADYSAARLLAAAQAGVAAIELAEDEQARDIAYRTALTGLTGLYQLHGCQWAYPRLKELASSPDCPEMYYGISADGRLAVSIDRLVLRNPIFDEYAIYLCSLESLTAEVLEHNGTGHASLEFRLADGTTITAEHLEPGHFLWDQLTRMERTFYPPSALYPGSALGFKQVFHLPGGHILHAETVVLTWGSYKLEIPVLQKESDD